jgi:hypothetical protein
MAPDGHVCAPAEQASAIIINVLIQTLMWIEPTFPSLNLASHMPYRIIRRLKGQLEGN